MFLFVLLLLICTSLSPIYAEELSPIQIIAEESPQVDKEIVKWDRVPIRKVITELAEKFDVEVVINGKLDGTVIARYANTSFEDILDKLSRTCLFKWVKMSDGTYLVTQSDNATMSETFKITYANKDDLKSTLSAYIPKEKIVVNAESGSLTVDANAFDLAKASSDIKKLDKPTKMVTIQLKIVEVNRDDSKNAGFNYALDNIKYDNRAPWKPQWTTTFNAESIFTSGKVLARPTTMTFNGRAAKFNVTDKLPVFETTIATDGTRQTTARYEEVGLDGLITPTVNEDPETSEQYISLDINQKFSSIVRIEKSDNVTAPVIAMREVKTTARVKNGETMIIGGLIKDEDRKTVTALPLLKDLPIFGSLFKNVDKDKIKTEMFIYITPIINNGVDETKIYNPNSSEVK